MKRIVAFILYVLLPPTFACSETISARVSAVVDGDTLEIVTGEEAPKKVRLYGIDAPELGQPYSEEARKFAREAIGDGTLAIEIKSTDLKGTEIVWAILPNGHALNEEVLEQGYAWLLPYIKSEDLKVLESGARAAHVGLWAQENPQEPWKYRTSGPPKLEGTASTKRETKTEENRYSVSPEELAERRNARPLPALEAPASSYVVPSPSCQTSTAPGFDPGAISGTEPPLVGPYRNALPQAQPYVGGTVNDSAPGYQARPGDYRSSTRYRPGSVDRLVVTGNTVIQERRFIPYGGKSFAPRKHPEGWIGPARTDRPKAQERPVNSPTREQ
ncbi:MAG: thermonuclease family protein [Candidatus Omnitrophica bacterium]|nr:thermonuclease family protein [Candidatus Omnitrophota bacterium]